MKMSTTAEQKHAVAAMKVQLKIVDCDWLMLGVAGCSVIFADEMFIIYDRKINGQLAVDFTIC